MFRSLVAALMLTAAPVAGGESDLEAAVPSPFQKEEGSWVAGFLNPEGTIVVRPQHDLAETSPFARLHETASPPSTVDTEFETAPRPSATDADTTDVATAETVTTETAASIAGPPTAGMAELAVNVPDLPQIVDRMGTAVLVLAVCLVAALFYRKRLALRASSTAAPPRMRVVGRMPVSRRGEVCLVEIDQRLMVVGLDSQGIRTLVPLEGAPAAAAVPAPTPDFATLHEHALNRREKSSRTPPRPRRTEPSELLTR